MPLVCIIRLFLVADMKSQNAAKYHIFFCKPDDKNDMFYVNLGNTGVKMERVLNKN